MGALSRAGWIRVFVVEEEELISVQLPARVQQSPPPCLCCNNRSAGLDCDADPSTHLPSGAIRSAISPQLHPDSLRSFGASLAQFEPDVRSYGYPPEQHYFRRGLHGQKI